MDPSVNTAKIFEHKLETIILTWDEHKQIDFLQIYPIFKPEKHLTSYWIKIYRNICTEIHESKNKVPLLQTKRDNAIRFLSMAYTHDYMDIDFSTTGRLIKVMEQCKEENKYLNMLKLSIIRIKNDTSRAMSDSQLYKSMTLGRNQKLWSSARPLITVPENILWLKPEEFANDITRLTANVYNQISKREFISYALQSDYDLYISNISKLTQMFDSLAYLVCTEILKRAKNDQERCQMIWHFIQIGNQLEKLGNFHLLFAIIAGLNNSNVQRIKPIWNEKQSYMKEFYELCKIADQGKGYSTYRNRVKDLTNYIPFIGVITHDIKRAIEGNNLYQNKDINWPVYNMIVSMIKSIPSYRHKISETSPYFELVEIITEEADLYTLSIKIYPKPISKMAITESVKLTLTNVIPVESPILYTRNHNSRNKRLSLPMIKSDNDNIVRKSRSMSLREVDNLGTIESKKFTRWSTNEVIEWLKKNGLDEYLDAFKKEDIQGDCLPYLTEKHMETRLGITKLGHRLKLIKLIRELA